jgi:uncharacterized protein (TIGR03437 family)
VANGRVYAGTADSLVVFGLLDAPRTLNLATGGPGPVAPGSIVAIEGGGLPSSNGVAQTVPLPGELDGVSVEVNGVPAPLFAVSAGEIIAQIPAEFPAGNATIRIAPAGPSFAAVLQPAAPGLFQSAPGRAAAVNPDGTLNDPGNPVSVGGFVASYLTGLGATDPPVANGVAAPLDPLALATGPVEATIGGQPADVIFAGLTPGFVGLFQVNVRIPQLAPGDYPLVVTAGGVPSNAAMVSVR